MKKLPARPDFVYKVYYPIIIGLGILLPYVSTYIPYAFHINWLFLVALLWLCLRGPKMDTNDRLSHWQRFSIYLMCLACFGAFIGIYFITHHYVKPIAPEYTLSLEHSFWQLAYYGLFPWPMTLFFAVYYRQQAQARKKPIYFSELLSPSLLPQKPLSMVINTFVKFTTIIWVAATGTFAVVAFYYLLATNTKVPVVCGPNFATIITMIALICVPRIKSFRQKLRQVFQRKFPIPLSLFLLIFITSVTLISVSTFFYSISGSHTRYPSHFYRWVQKADWEVYWQLLMGLWWLVSTIPMGLFIANQTRKVSLWQMLSTASLMPIMVFTAFFLGEHFQWQLSNHSGFILTLYFISILILFFGILRWQTLGLFVSSYLPYEQNVKTRNPQKWLRQILGAAVSAIYIFLPGGVVSASYAITCMLTVPLLFIFTTCLVCSITTPTA